MAGDSHADCASGWKGLAELQYENMDYQAAYDTAVRGLTWLQSRWVGVGCGVVGGLGATGMEDCQRALGGGVGAPEGHQAGTQRTDCQAGW